MNEEQLKYLVEQIALLQANQKKTMQELAQVSSAFICAFSALLYETTIDKDRFLQHLLLFSGQVAKSFEDPEAFFRAYNAIRIAAENAKKAGAS